MLHFIKIQKKYLPFLFGLTLLSALWSPGKALAAKLYFTPQSEQVGLAGNFLVNVTLETTDAINALTATINISGEAEVVDIISGNSIINFWVEKPAYDPQARQLTFSGIIPGGFSEAQGRLLMIKFKPLKEGRLRLTFLPNKTEVFLNTPDGLKDKLTLSNLSLPILKGAANIELSNWQDAVAPENFQPQVAQDPNLFDGQNFLIFATQDKGLGIDHYEVQEKILSRVFNFPLWDSGWQTTDSPYLLQDQKLTSQISVKAVDRAGNATLSKLSPTKPLDWYKDQGIWVIMILILIFAAVVFLTKNFWRQPFQKIFRKK